MGRSFLKGSPKPRFLVVFLVFSRISIIPKNVVFRGSLRIYEIRGKSWFSTVFRIFCGEGLGAKYLSFLKLGYTYFSRIFSWFWIKRSIYTKKSEIWQETRYRDSKHFSSGLVVKKKTTFFHNYLKMWILVKIGYFQRKSHISRNSWFIVDFKKIPISSKFYEKNRVFLNCPLLAKRKI